MIPWNRQQLSTPVEDPNDLDAYLAKLSSSPNQPAVPATPAALPVLKKKAVTPPAQAAPTPPMAAPQPPDSLAWAAGFPKGGPVAANAEEDTSAKNTTGQNRNAYADEDQLNQLYGLLRKQPEFQAQKEGQAGLYNLLAMEARQPATPSLAGLGDFANYATHGKFKASPEPDANGRYQRESLLKYGEKAQDDQRDIARTLQQGVQTLKIGNDSNNLMTALALKAGLKTAPPETAKGVTAPVTNLDKWVKMVKADQGKHEETMNEIQAIRTAVNSGNPNEQKNVPIALAKMFAGARPAYQEVKMEGGDPALMARIDQTYRTLKWGSFTPTNIRNYNGFMDDMERLQAAHMQLKRKKNATLARGYGVDDAMRDATLGGYNYGNPPGPKKSIQEQILEKLNGK